MKKIIPFNNVLEFNTDVKEITAISLEHEIQKHSDMISGTFYISGEYKMIDGQLEKEKFNFELPFDIALSSNYNLESLLVDIDDFRYDIVSDKDLKVNIDLYIDGEEIEPPLERTTYFEELPQKEDTSDLTDEIISSIKKDEETIISNKEEIEPIKEEPLLEEQKENTEIEESFENSSNIVAETERIDLLKDMLTTHKEDSMEEESNISNNNQNTNINIFEPNQDEDKYVTYRVYKVLDTDTIDTILTKYNVTKEMLSDYNNIENITPGDKLIIPTNEK